MTPSSQKSGKEVRIHFIKHASLILEVDEKLMYIDPTGMFGNDFTKLPKADAVMVTHEHHDHFDPQTIEIISGPDARFIGNGRVVELVGNGEPMAPGDTLNLLGMNLRQYRKIIRYMNNFSVLDFIELSL